MLQDVEPCGAVDSEDVERHIRRWVLPRQSGDSGRPGSHAVLKMVEAEPFFDPHNQLTIKNHPGRYLVTSRFNQIWKRC